MAVRQNNLSLKNCQTYEEDGFIYVEEFTKDGSNTFILNDLLSEFAGDERFIDITIREKFDVEGIDGD